MRLSKAIFRKVRRIGLMILALLLVGIIIITGILLLWSPGKVEPFLDENGDVLENSVSEKICTGINDVEQGMIIRGANTSNPILLFLHGGPGMPEYFLAEQYLSALEEHFTICYWEQRGSGLSYNSELQAETITAELLISDTLEVTYYLRERFGREKIYIMGHSWGTFIGIQAAAQKPELYYAYIGIGQISNELESERLAYSYMLEQYELAENTKMVRKLEHYPIFESDTALSSYLSSSLRDEAMHKLGIGTMRDMKSVVSGIFLPAMQCRAYTLGEKINIWRGKSFLGSSTDLRKQMYSTDLSVEVTQLEIPVYLMSGIYDYTVSYDLSKDYFLKIQAPMKGFYTFDYSAHSPLFEEPDNFLEIMLEDVLPATINLAD